mmetsp:Transcript_25552/g.37132  ORF Transcript_25552/g.37132 Transcript_25552/m.37132 type:complete len:245 (+) Transcript_25552:410-1144(+)
MNNNDLIRVVTGVARTSFWNVEDSMMYINDQLDIMVAPLGFKNTMHWSSILIGAVSFVFCCQLSLLIRRSIHHHRQTKNDNTDVSTKTFGEVSSDDKALNIFFRTNLQRLAESNESHGQITAYTLKNEKKNIRENENHCTKKSNPNINGIPQFDKDQIQHLNELHTADSTRTLSWESFDFSCSSSVDSLHTSVNEETTMESPIGWDLEVGTPEILKEIIKPVKRNLDDELCRFHKMSLLCCSID